MRLPAPRLAGRTSLSLTATAAAMLLSGLAMAQQPATPATDTAPPAAKKTAGKAPAARSPSYSLGVSMGDQLRNNGVSSEKVNASLLAQGVHDALAGKATFNDADKQNISKLISEAQASAGEGNHRAAAKFLADNGKKPGVVTTASGLEYKILTPGSGDSPKPTDEVTVNYKGTLIDGTEFDSSYKRSEPAKFPLNHVIPGWSEGVGLMKPGAKYEFWVPPQLAYDLRPPPGGPIPPGSLLIFEVELLSTKAAPPAGAMAPKPALPSSGTTPPTSSGTTPPPK